MNQLAQLPPSISGLTALAQLALSINPLRQLPPGLAQLGRLAMLELYYVQLEGLGQLEQLRAALPRWATAAAAVPLQRGPGRRAISPLPPPLPPGRRVCCL
jgi:hypothetical protein